LVPWSWNRSGSRTRFSDHPARRRAALDFGWRSRAAGVEASGDDRLSRQSTIMGPAGLTAVFGMGTGVAPPVWSPERRPAGRQTTPVPNGAGSATHESSCSAHLGARDTPPNPASLSASERSFGSARLWLARPPLGSPAPGSGESPSGWSSYLAVRTGRLKRSPAVHARPIDLVVFQEPSSRAIGTGNLISEGASRLDAFSAYPLPTWLPGDAPSGTAGTPEVGPPQSSRTRGDSPQVSYAHGR
jgi:hypothetical protein